MYIADLLVQTNCDSYAIAIKKYNHRSQAKKPEKETRVIKGMPIGTLDIPTLNSVIEYRLLRELGYKEGNYKTAKQNHSVQVIEILNYREINGY